jgi:hypothetical protein
MVKIFGNDCFGVVFGFVFRLLPERYMSLVMNNGKLSRVLKAGFLVLFTGF